MNRRLLIIGIVIICILVGGLFTLHILMGLSIKQNIKLAQQKYPGRAEDALISYMMDENISAEGRTHEAIVAIEKGGLISYARLNK